MAGKRIIIGRLGMVVVAGGLASACGLFKSTTRLEVRSFSESTIAVTGDIRYGVWDVTSIYLQPYAGGPEQVRAEAIAEELRAAVISIIAYSVDVVALGRSDLPPQRRAGLYGDRLLELATLPLDRGWPDYPYSREQLEALADSARAQAKLLDALAMAQPVIDALVDVGAELIDSLDAQVIRAYDEILAGIERDHAAELQFDALAKGGQLQMFREVQLLSEYRRGERAALDSLYVIFPEARELAENDPPTRADLLRIEDRITERFGRLSNAVGQLQPRLTLYYAKLRELEARNNAMTQRLSRGRLALVAWSLGHQRLASGVTDPARIDVGGILTSLTRRL
ncbi:MAG: hypothetical protein PVI01_05465 [Gemmatimonadales bacterium]